MSFSSELKENLSKIQNLKNKELVKFELIGYLISNNTTCDKKNIYYTTVNEYNINRFSKLLSNIDISNFKIDIKGKNYIITVPKIQKIGQISYLEKDIEIKSLARGIFLGSGSVNNPENKYHLEMILSTKENAIEIQKILQKMQIKFKLLSRENGYSLYIKEGEEISKFLAFLGANSSVIRFEEIRVIREMKNSINRKVNCETANLSKTISAAVKQIEAIKKLQMENKFENLPDNLKEIANLRLENPDSSLAELGQMLKNPIGKSGVNHRLNQLIELAIK